MLVTHALFWMLPRCVRGLQSPLLDDRESRCLRVCEFECVANLLAVLTSFSDNTGRILLAWCLQRDRADGHRVQGAVLSVAFKLVRTSRHAPDS
jgi:hypothetical protein